MISVDYILSFFLCLFIQNLLVSYAKQGVMVEMFSNFKHPHKAEDYYEMQK